MDEFPPISEETRLAIVISHPTQYYSPWFRWLDAHTDLKVRVFYLWDSGVRPTRDQQFQATFAWDVDLLSGYDHEFVPNAAGDPGTHHFKGLRNPLLTSRLRAWKPSAVLLFGYKSISQLQVIAWAKFNRVPLIFRGDSHLIGRKRPAAHARAALRLLYRQFAAITFVGQANANYFEQLGVPCKKLFFAPHAVDDSYFNPDRMEVKTAALALRVKLGILPETRVVLFAGKLVPAKQPVELLMAFMELRVRGTALVFVGDGEEKITLMERARAAEPGTVFFLPFANQSEMPSRYLMADIFALPSKGFYETWGLAVNEAMHLGLPALVSDRVGCQRDLVTDGETGWVFRADDSDHLRDQLSAALRADLAPIKKNVAERIAGYTYAKAADGLVLSVNYAIS
jgi:glycosyltransferase involved in cell wall biosynthesis